MSVEILFSLLALSAASAAASGQALHTFFRAPFLNPLPAGLHLVDSSPAGDAVHVSLSGSFDSEFIRQQTRVKLPSEAWATPPPTDPFAYSGYLTVDERYDSNLFYWFFEAQNGNKSAPIILWLQGGPGSSSLFGLFGEHGPFYLTDDLKLMPRNLTWNREFSLLYIDNPVGVGFSYTMDSSQFCTDEDCVANNMYTALTAFFTVYSEYASNEFYVTGESYGGKYVPVVSSKIHQENQRQPKVPINLAGIAIGDGLTDPVTQLMGYADILYNIGIADEWQTQTLYTMQRQLRDLIIEKRWKDASDAFSAMVNGPPDYYSTITGSYDYYDIRYTVGPSYGGDYFTFVNQSSIRAALHVGDHFFYANGSAPGDALYDDICKSVVDVVPTLMENYKVLWYNGQFDFIVAPPLTEEMLYQLPWQGLGSYLAANRTIWRVHPDDVEVAGYVRQAGVYPVFQAVVRSAGHMVPADQPERGLDMITRFIKDIPFSD